MNKYQEQLYAFFEREGTLTILGNLAAYVETHPIDAVSRDYMRIEAANLTRAIEAATLREDYEGEEDEDDETNNLKEA